jgi:hypothetical protein
MVKETNLNERLVSIETFEKFKRIARKTLLENPDFNIKRNILQKFIHRVEIGVDRLRIFWNLDQENFESEMKIKKPEARDSGFLKHPANSGSQSLTNGARDWTRTSMLLRAPPSEDGMSTNFTTRAFIKFFKQKKRNPRAPFGLMVVSHSSSSKKLVPRTGLEPACLAAPPPQDGVSTNSTTWAQMLNKASP